MLFLLIQTFFNDEEPRVPAERLSEELPLRLFAAPRGLPDFGAVRAWLAHGPGSFTRPWF